jgi:hypothetical protein
MNLANILWFIFLGIVIGFGFLIFYILISDYRSNKMTEKNFIKNYKDWFYEKYFK